MVIPSRIQGCNYREKITPTDLLPSLELYEMLSVSCSTWNWADDCEYWMTCPSTVLPHIYIGSRKWIDEDSCCAREGYYKVTYSHFVTLAIRERMAWVVRIVSPIVTWQVLESIWTGNKTVRECYTWLRCSPYQESQMNTNWKFFGRGSSTEHWRWVKSSSTTTWSPRTRCCCLRGPVTSVRWQNH